MALSEDDAWHAGLAAQVQALRTGAIVLQCERPGDGRVEPVAVVGPLRVEGFAVSLAGIERVEVAVSGRGSWRLTRPHHRSDIRLRFLGVGLDLGDTASGFRVTIPTDDWAPGTYRVRVAAHDCTGSRQECWLQLRWAPSDSHGNPADGAQSYLTALAHGRPAVWWSSPSAGDPPVGRFVTVTGWAASPAGIEHVAVELDGRRMQARRTTAGPAIRSRLRNLVPAGGVVGYQLVLDLGTVPTGSHELAVVARAADGREVTRHGPISVDAGERYRRWSVLSHEYNRIAGRPRRPVQAIRVCALPAPAGEPLRLAASLARQTHTCWRMDELSGSLARALESLAEQVDDAPPVLLVPACDQLHPRALESFAARFGSDAAPDVVYADDEQLDRDRGQAGVRLKPGWSPELLLQHDYIGPVVALGPNAARAALADGDQPATPYELLLALTDAAVRVERIPKVLSARATAPTEDPDRVGSALRAIAQRRGRELRVEPLSRAPASQRVRWRLQRRPLVTAVIPTTGTNDWLEPCLRSLRTTTDYAQLEVVLVDSGTEDLARSIAARALGDVPYEVVPYTQAKGRPRDFNFSHACNIGAQHATGEQLLFMNDDLEALHPDWLERMVEQATLPQIGVVGVLLQWDEGLIQHCGLALQGSGAGGVVDARELFSGLEAASSGPDGLLTRTHECTAVTGACLMVPRTLLARLGGWDLHFGLDYGDVDLCLRVWEAGHRVVVMPSVVLRHRHSATREGRESEQDRRRFRTRWADALRDGDPWHHPAYRAARDGVLELPGDSF